MRHFLLLFPLYVILYTFFLSPASALLDCSAESGTCYKNNWYCSGGSIIPGTNCPLDYICYVGGTCVVSSPTPACLPNDSACSNSGQCCSNFCWISRCAAPAPSPTTSPCAVFNQSCFNLPCCSSSPPLFCDFGSGTVCHYTSASPTPSTNNCLAPSVCKAIPQSGETCTGPFTFCGTTGQPGYCCSSSTTTIAPLPTLPTTDIICNGDGIKTPLGCLPIGTGTSAGRITITTLVAWAVGVAGAIAILLIIYSAFQITTASGDPKRVKAGQELLVAALGGLALIALAVTALNFLGLKVLNLGSLGFNI